MFPTVAPTLAIVMVTAIVSVLKEVGNRSTTTAKITAMQIRDNATEREDRAKVAPVLFEKYKDAVSRPEAMAWITGKLVVNKCCGLVEMLNLI